MNDVTRFFAIVCALLFGRIGGVKPNNIYCIGNQCFTVSKTPRDFSAAQNECQDQGGHLMTVRSSVSQDVLSVLLGNVSDRFWIGLHLPTGCPDQSTELNGFRWVTGDRESDFSNWPTTFNSSCSSHRCVSVSPVDDFKWTREPCVKQAARFLCEASFNETCNSLEAGVNDILNYSTPFGFTGEDLLTLPPGSTAVRLPAERKYICFSGRWVQAPWKCDVLEGGCEHKCTLDPEEQPLCYCPRGKAINPENKVTCEEAQADPCASLRCAHACYENEGSYVCTCIQGFKLAADGRSCLDFNDCTDARQCPGENTRCVNTVGGFQCACKDGYRNTGGVCADVNECISAPCEHMCQNVPGSYKCSCYNGYKEDPEKPHMCKLHCGKQECLAQCDPNDNNQCYCPGGYILEERHPNSVCIDIDECTSFYCDQDCENTYGSYVCNCFPGYKLDDNSNCVKTGDEPDTDEGSGAPSTFPSITAAPPHPDPTTDPSALTAGGLVGIVLCALFFIALVICIAYRVLCRRRKMEGADGVKDSENEAHTLQPVTSDA